MLGQLKEITIVINKKMELPKEIEWNIIKFMSHPIAEIMKPLIQQFRHGFAYDFYFERGMDYSRKHFHLVILDTIREDKEWDPF